jgi:MYXO-CTERM domain-containing protein
MGCGCGVPAGSSNMGLLLLIAGAALLRRSRRQRS